MKKEEKNKMLIGILILMLASSCTTKKNLGDSNSTNDLMINQNPFTELKKEIEYHGTISPYRKGSPKVLRSNIDSLNKDEAIEINNFITSLNDEYLSKVEFVMVNYYPGKDDCNSTGMATLDDIGFSNEKLNKELSKRKQITQLNVFKNDDGISRWNKNRKWEFDENLMIANQFFSEHYPCSSYLILHKSGKYYYYFGESSVEKKVKDIDLFMESIFKGLI